MIMRIELFDFNSNKYIFELCPIGTELNNFAGLYTFCCYSKISKNWPILYIGQTGDFSERIDDNLLRHQKLECSLKKGATHVGLYPLKGGKNIRKKLEEELISYYEPPCNGRVKY